MGTSSINVVCSRMHRFHIRPYEDGFASFERCYGSVKWNKRPVCSLQTLHTDSTWNWGGVAGRKGYGT